MSRQNPYPRNTFEHSQWNNREGFIESVNRNRPPGPRTTSGRPFLSQPSRPVIDANQWKQWANEVSRDNVNGPWDRVQNTANPNPTATNVANATRQALENPAQATRLKPPRIAPRTGLVNTAGKVAPAAVGVVGALPLALSLPGEIRETAHALRRRGEIARQTGRDVISNPTPAHLAETAFGIATGSAVDIARGAIDELREAEQYDQALPDDSIAPSSVTSTVYGEPPFEGGQMNTNYTFALTFRRFRCDGVIQTASSSTSGIKGPISVTETRTPFTSGSTQFIDYKYNVLDRDGIRRGGTSAGLIQQCTSETPTNFYEIAIVDTTVTRDDGQPDTGGNPLGPASQETVTIPNETRQSIQVQPATSIPPSFDTSPLKSDTWQPDRQGNLPYVPIPPVEPEPQRIEQQPPELEPTREWEQPGYQPTPGLPTPVTPQEGEPATPPQTAPNNVPEPDPGKSRGRQLAEAAGKGAAIGAALVGAGAIVDRLKGNETGAEASGKRNIPPEQPPTSAPPNCGCNPALIEQMNANKRELLQALGGPAGEAVSTAAILDKLNAMQQFAEKAWDATKIQKVLDMLTLIGVLHNVSMLSRDVAETFGYALDNGLQAIGVKLSDEEGNQIGVTELVGGTVEDFIISIIGADAYADLRENYRKANRIVQTGSMIIWTIRSIQDSALDLTEWIAENTGKIGNALKRFGVVGERAYPWMSESAQARNRFRARFDKVTGQLENAENIASSFATGTSNVLELTQETQELGENFASFRQSVTDFAPGPDLENQPVAVGAATDAANSQSPDVSAVDADNAP